MSILPDYRAYQRMLRSMLTSFLNTVGLRHLNRLAAWRGVEAFGAEEVPALEFALIESALYGKPGYASLWYEDEGRVILGLSNKVAMRKHFAGTRMPMSLLREVAHEVAVQLVVGSEVPYRVRTYEVRKARQAWMQAPDGTEEAPDLGVISERDLAYFKEHGVYPPHWRPEGQRASEWGKVAAGKSWENRKFDSTLLLGLPQGLTAQEQVRALREKNIPVSVATINRWRKSLIDNGFVVRGREPWHTGTVTRANSKKI